MKVINLDKEIFEHACNLCERDFSYEEIINILKFGNDVEKQIAILKISYIQNKEDANLLVSHLTGHDGPIREAVAVKLNELFSLDKSELLDNKDFYPVFVDAVCDVNPNVSRTVISYLSKLNSLENLLELLLNKVERVYDRIEAPDIDQKNFLTVRLFNLYWCFEAIGELLEGIKHFGDVERLCGLLEKAVLFNNYTIDEKVARILRLSFFENNREQIFSKIQNIDNFYVKRYLAK